MKDRNRPNFVVIGCPENRRVSLFQAALGRLSLAQAQVVSWLDVLGNPSALEDLVDSETIVRIESAGENFAVERELIALGADTQAELNRRSIGAHQARRLEFDCGRILYPRQCFAGFLTVLERLSKACELQKPALLMNHPDDIALMFEKPKCHAWLDRLGVSVPRSLGAISSYDHLREEMKARGWRRVFIKLACGSSASGVIAYETNWQREQAWTSVELVQKEQELRLYNSLKVRRYTKTQEIAAMVDWLCGEGVQVEEWIPKAGFDGCASDLRMLAICGQAAHTAVRLSKSPMTNLHLGNRRGDLEAYRRRTGEAVWQRIEQLCRQVADGFPRSLQVGVDVGLTPDFKRIVVFEVNAFGDLLPNVLHKGKDTYESEILAALVRCGHEAQKASRICGT